MDFHMNHVVKVVYNAFKQNIFLIRSLSHSVQTNYPDFHYILNFKDKN